MDLHEVIARSDQLGGAGALAVLDEALAVVERQPERDLRAWAELTYRRALWLVDIGRSGEAVRCAGRLVEAIGDPALDWEPTELGEAMTMLARAFEADLDLTGAQGVMRLMQSRFGADGAGAAARMHARADALMGRYLREDGQPEAAVTQLEDTLAALAESADPGVRAERTRARAELALTYLALGQTDAAIQVGYGLTGASDELPSLIRRFVLSVCRELMLSTAAAGRTAESILFSRAAMALLAAETTAGARSERAAICVSVAQDLAQLDRPQEARVVCDDCLETYAHDADPATVESAVVAGCLGAQITLALGDPAGAAARAQRLIPLVPAANPHRLELDGRIGLVIAGAELEIHGPRAAERVYRSLVEDLRGSGDPGVGLFLAFALDMQCAVFAQLERLDDSAGAGAELAELIRAFPRHANFPAVAECGNRTAIRLILRGRPGPAAELARAVIRRHDELLGGPDQAVCVRAYVLAADAFRAHDPSALNGLWQEILALGEPGLAVFDGLAEQYASRGDSRVALVYTYIGRATVLASLGRDREAAEVAEAIIAEFGADEDEQVQRILRQLRPD